LLRESYIYSVRKNYDHFFKVATEPLWGAKLQKANLRGAKMFKKDIKRYGLVNRGLIGI